MKECKIVFEFFPPVPTVAPKNLENYKNILSAQTVKRLLQQQ